MWLLHFKHVRTNNKIGTVPENVRRENNRNLDFSVTLVSQSSVERLWLMRETCMRWKGPIILVIYVRTLNDLSSGEYLKIPKPDGNLGILGEDICPNVHVISYCPTMEGEDANSNEYPVNRLRNIGLKAVRTTHMLYIDIDFWPSVELERHILNYAHSSEYGNIFAAEQNAVVVPSFNFLSISHGCRYADICRQTYQREAPKTFLDLIHCLEQRDCQVSFYN